MVEAKVRSSVHANREDGMRQLERDIPRRQPHDSAFTGSQANSARRAHLQLTSVRKSAKMRRSYHHVMRMSGESKLMAMAVGGFSLFCAMAVAIIYLHVCIATNQRQIAILNAALDRQNQRHAVLTAKYAGLSSAQSIGFRATDQKMALNAPNDKIAVPDAPVTLGVRQVASAE